MTKAKEIDNLKSQLTMLVQDDEKNQETIIKQAQIIKSNKEHTDEIITELKKEIERLNEEKSKLENIIVELNSENEKLINRFVNDKLKQRINKAIEYLENNLLDHNSPLWCDSCEEDNKKLLEILEGEDNE